jgi:Flp pilus assembly protein TadG
MSRHFGHRRSVAAVEFAIILPVMMLMVTGIIEFGAILQVYKATNRLATQYALSWADCYNTGTVTCQTELTTYTNATTISNLAPQLTIGNLLLTMVQFTVNNGTPSIVNSGGYPSANAGQIATATSIATTAFTSTATANEPQTIVVVVAQYNHTLRYFPTFMSTFLGNALTTNYAVSQLNQTTNQ